MSGGPVRPLPILRVDWPNAASILGPFLHPGGEGMSRRILELAGLEEADVLVDLGAGSGATLALASRLYGVIRGVGIDPSPFPDAAAGASLVRGSGRSLPLRSGSVGAVIAECSLCLMRPLESTLSEVHRVLSPGGRLVFSDPYVSVPKAWTSEALAMAACLFEARTSDDLLGALAAAGFGDVAMEDASEALWEIEDRVQRTLDVRGLVRALAREGGPWARGAAFLDEVTRARDGGALRYGIFSGRKPRA